MKKLFIMPAGMMLISIAAFTPASTKTNSISHKINRTVFAQMPTKWTLDKTHSSVLFSVSHLVVSDVEGSFKSFDGSVENTKDDFSDAKIDFAIDVKSINTDNENRDKHLQSDDFFNAEKFPQIKFASTSFNHWVITNIN